MPRCTRTGNNLDKGPAPKTLTRSRPRGYSINSPRLSLWAKLVSVSKPQFISSGLYIIKGTVTVYLAQNTHCWKTKILLLDLQNFYWYILSNMFIIQNTRCVKKKKAHEQILQSPCAPFLWINHQIYKGLFGPSFFD